MAIFFALRKTMQHTELSLTRLHFDNDGGPISLELELSTYSHAPKLTAKARLKMGGVDYPLKLELPIKVPINSNISVLNTFPLHFVGQYVKSKTLPQAALIDVKARFSDGSKARLRKKVILESADNPNEPMPDKGGSQN